MTIILGIDPGLAHAGLAVIYREGSSARWVDGREIRTDPTWPLARRLERMLWGARSTAEEANRWLAHQRGGVVMRMVAAIEDYEARAGGGRSDRRACPTCRSPGGRAAAAEIARFRRTAVPHGMAMGALLAGLMGIELAEPPIRAVDWHRRLRLPAGAPKTAAQQFAFAAIEGIPPELPDHVTDAACIAMAARIPAGTPVG